MEGRERMTSPFALGEVVEGAEKGVFAVGYQVLWPCGAEGKTWPMV